MKKYFLTLLTFLSITSMAETKSSFVVEIPTLKLNKNLKIQRIGSGKFLQRKNREDYNSSYIGLIDILPLIDQEDFENSSKGEVSNIEIINVQLTNEAEVILNHTCTIKFVKDNSRLIIQPIYKNYVLMKRETIDKNIKTCSDLLLGKNTLANFLNVAIEVTYKSPEVSTEKTKIEESKEIGSIPQ